MTAGTECMTDWHEPDISQSHTHIMECDCLSSGWRQAAAQAKIVNIIIINLLYLKIAKNSSTDHEVTACRPHTLASKQGGKVSSQVAILSVLL